MGKRTKPNLVDRTKKYLGIGQPEYEGPSARDITRGTVISHDVKADEIAAQFEDTVGDTDPYRTLPDEMDGVIQLRGPGEVDAEEQYAAVISDPTSVLAPRKYADPSVQSDPVVDRDVRAAQRRVSEAHDPERIERIREGLEIEPFNQVGDDD